MKKILSLVLTISFTSLVYSQSQTFYRTATSYESFKWDKLPFVMATLTISQISKDSIKIADKAFYNNGHNVFITQDGKGWLVVVEKGAFIVTPDGVNWTCYYRDKERIREITAFPNYWGEDELKILKEAMTTYKKPDERIQNFYITYTSYQSKANTNYAEDVLPVIFISDDSITVRGILFKKYSNNFYKDASGVYLYVKDKENLVFRDQNFTTWATFYVKDQQKATQLISQEYKPEKELADINQMIDNARTNVHSKIINNYVNNLRPAKKDPQIEDAIKNYWNKRWPGAPVTKVILLDNDFSVVRNSLWVPLRKVMTVWVLYKENGKCYMQWHQYGYEALGGGQFATGLSQWKMSSVDYALSAGNLNLFSGERYEVDCK